MNNYSRLKTINIPGHAYFITTRVNKGLSIFDADSICNIIIKNFDYYRKAKQFKLLGYVIMSNHLHYLLYPYGRYSVSEILRDFKKQTSKDIIKELKIIKREGWIRNPTVNIGDGITNPIFTPAEWARRMLGKMYINSKKQEYKVWQSNNWVTNIYSGKFFSVKLNYIHNNPVKAGIVKESVDYKYSSARNYYFSDETVIKIDCNYLNH